MHQFLYCLSPLQSYNQIWTKATEALKIHLHSLTRTEKDILNIKHACWHFQKSMKSITICSHKNQLNNRLKLKNLSKGWVVSGPWGSTATEKDTSKTELVTSISHHGRRLEVTSCVTPNKECRKDSKWSIPKKRGAMCSPEFHQQKQPGSTIIAWWTVPGPCLPRIETGRRVTLISKLNDRKPKQTQT